ncbi:CMP-N-acetylneuraminate-beta-galactosamide-alpha-2,3-sialyltransferase 1-like [Gouania willdenowi]|uniref:CMP-N-acetylneuraminate-beta-galactosamide- alpha-2,3-sialyltransferase 1-like n=1 Tax=Gouania willdenowi TaxID=441366 RepID=UPI0010544302|nr:CMP-N-acetylneuraminate-beta-galactosamide-alpha-2,3-sialyltransferase 1-like [Gouania willdenowi]
MVTEVPSTHPIIVIPTNSTPTKKLRLCSCENCLTEDQRLLKHRLDTFVQPLLSRNYSLSSDDHKWWTQLQGKKSNFNDYQTAVQSLFQLFPPVPDVAEPKSDKCRSCAVVGNSPRLLGANYGQIIDSKDVVIRINKGPVEGFGKDVGTKTTHRAMYPVSAVNLDNSTHLLFFAFKLSDLQWLMEALTTGYKGKSPVLSKMNANKNLVMVVNPAFMKYVHKWLGRSQKGNYPSTGMLTVFLALFICDEVHVFGFGADKRGHWNHYWEKPQQNLTDVKGNHPRSTEYSILKQLDKDRRIKFYEGG